MTTISPTIDVETTTQIGTDDPVAHITENAGSEYSLCGAYIKDSTATPLSPICRKCMIEAGVLGISPDQFFDEYEWNDDGAA